ncbi:uncharacterized protein LOC119276161 [Triticum dicoccoides]|uniref:uncharacterized protein LOC119276161 n=1 Tax=Triticum dicoccoides TaxID=85692 RepID=UPI00188E10B1|nr:uncharacterized protein LOC119276161 [Triticum dicoccoides]
MGAETSSVLRAPPSQHILYCELDDDGGVFLAGKIPNCWSSFVISLKCNLGDNWTSSSGGQQPTRTATRNFRIIGRTATINFRITKSSVEAGAGTGIGVPAVRNSGGVGGSGASASPTSSNGGSRGVHHRDHHQLPAAKRTSLVAEADQRGAVRQRSRGRQAVSWVAMVLLVGGRRSSCPWPAEVLLVGGLVGRLLGGAWPARGRRMAWSSAWRCRSGNSPSGGWRR